MIDFDFTVPVLVAGGGACGAVAALAAADAGVTPLVIDRNDRAGGSTGMSQGLFCAAGSESQKAHGIDDNPDIFFADIMAKARGKTDPVIARSIADNSAPALEWLRNSHDLPWELDTSFRASYGNSRARIHCWPGHSGLEMVQLLHRRMSDAGVDVLMETKLVDIYTGEDGRVTGIAAQRKNGEIERIGCENLILACGGFGANRQMTDLYMPETAMLKYNGHEGSDGEAIFLAERMGAKLGDMGSYQGYAMLTDPQGITVPPPIIIEGGVIVNISGDRFTDESLDIAGMVHPIAQQPDGRCWVIYDEEIEARCAHIPEMTMLNELNAPKQAESADGLARLINVEPHKLAHALTEAQAAASVGAADSFGRSWSDDRPPQGRMRALRVTGALYHTQGGLQIDGQARVLRGDGSAFPNLFAGGGSARSVSGPSSWGYLPAIGLTTAVVFGRQAGLASGA